MHAIIYNNLIRNPFTLICLLCLNNCKEKLLGLKATNKVNVLECSQLLLLCRTERNDDLRHSLSVGSDRPAYKRSRNRTFSISHPESSIMYVAKWMGYSTNRTPNQHMSHYHFAQTLGVMRLNPFARGITLSWK